MHEEVEKLALISFYAEIKLVHSKLRAMTSSMLLSSVQMSDHRSCSVSIAKCWPAFNSSVVLL